MSGTILAIGPSHHTASVASRERFALVGDTARTLTRELLASPHVLEVVALATCNRSELYLHVSDTDRSLPLVFAAFARLADAGTEEIAAVTDVYVDADAVRHLCRVSSGLESVVVGESEIQGQVRDALARAQEDETCGAILGRLFQHAIETGRAVRSRTAIGSGNASLGSVAATLVERELGGLDGAQVLVVGAGEMSELAARAMQDRGAANVLVANRNHERAAELAAALSGRAVHFDSVHDELVRADAVVSATSAPHLLLRAEHLERASRERGGRVLTLLDLAVPRDIDPAAGDVPGCVLYDIDDLERAVATTMTGRISASDEAVQITEAAVAEYEQWRSSLRVVPAIRQLRHHAEYIRNRELERFEGRLAHLAAEDRRRVEQLTRSIVNKLLHEPTVRLRERPVTPDEPRDLEATVLDLFGIEHADRVG